jgi:hypothetical protein
MSFKEIQDEVISKYRITIVENSKCYSRTHIHVKQRKICKWKQASSIQSTFTLFHEIGHAENNNSKMRRCEEEYYATVWAIDKCKEYGLKIPQSIIDNYQRYIYRELARGHRHRGNNYPTREEMRLEGARVPLT